MQFPPPPRNNRQYGTRDSITIPFPTIAPPAYSSPSPPAYSPDPPGQEPTTLGLDDPALWQDPPPTATGRLHPRAAVLLGLSNHWHKWLYFCRLLSVFPELRFGIPMLWTLLWFVLGDKDIREGFKARGNVIVVFVEVFLAAVWVRFNFSYHSTKANVGLVCRFWLPLFLLNGLSDDEMVLYKYTLYLKDPTNNYRLIIYSPIASIIRLITASFIYYVGTNFILQYSGSNLDPSLLLPAWISIAAVRFPFYFFEITANV
jgi:hypothetical protein